MTAISPERPTGSVPGPCLTIRPLAGPVITLLFLATIALFVIGLAAL